MDQNPKDKDQLAKKDEEGQSKEKPVPGSSAEPKQTEPSTTSGSQTPGTYSKLPESIRAAVAPTTQRRPDDSWIQQRPATRQPLLAPRQPLGRVQPDTSWIRHRASQPARPAPRPVGRLPQDMYEAFFGRQPQPTQARPVQLRAPLKSSSETSLDWALEGQRSEEDANQPAGTQQVEEKPPEDEIEPPSDNSAEDLPDVDRQARRDAGSREWNRSEGKSEEEDEKPKQ